jgi:hypothetical protein
VEVNEREWSLDSREHVHHTVGGAGGRFSQPVQHNNCITTIIGNLNTATHFTSFQADNKHTVSHTHLHATKHFPVP